MDPRPPLLITFGKSVSDDEILAEFRKWVNVLASQKYDVALDMTIHPPVMTPDFIRKIIEGYGGAAGGTGAHQVTSWDTADIRPSDIGRSSGEFPYRIIARREDNGLPLSLDLSLPIDGYWSYLVAVFGFEEHDNELAAHFEDLLVP